MIHVGSVHVLPPSHCAQKHSSVSATPSNAPVIKHLTLMKLFCLGKCRSIYMTIMEGDTAFT